MRYRVLFSLLVLIGLILAASPYSLTAQALPTTPGGPGHVPCDARVAHQVPTLRVGHGQQANHGDIENNFGDSVPPWFYHRPMIATIDGKSLKGSDYLWAAYRRALDRVPDFFVPTRQASLGANDLAEVFRADDGVNPMPAFDLHWQQAQAYGRDMQALRWTPSQIVEEANQASQPRQTFLSMLDHVGGYKEDPLRKKSMLLALILEQRPEKFLRPAPPEAEPPVIDYHLMRSCLRVGLIQIDDEALRQQVIQRAEISAEDEWAIRFAAYQAIQQVQQQSGRSMGAVDWFFFNARRRCPEMTEPDCPHCPVDPVCAHRKELFQPVRRTAFY
jgi:hypothetical protein